jgi:hypothetical protein
MEHKQIRLEEMAVAVEEMVGEHLEHLGNQHLVKVTLVE